MVKPYQTSPATWARRIDRIVVGWALLHAMVLLVLGWAGGVLQTALGQTAACLAVAGVLYALAPRTRFAHRLLPAVLVTLVVLQMATPYAPREASFDIFLVLSVLPLYRDARLIVVAGVAFAAAHAWLARHGLPHASAYWIYGGIAAQSVYLAGVAAAQGRLEAERFEVNFLIRAMGDDGPIRLNLDVLRADSTAGKRLKHVQARMAAAMRQMRASTEGVRRASDVLSAGSSELNQRTHTTASGLRDAAMCLEQINVIVQTSAQASLEARSKAAHATELAVSGGEQVTQVVDTMQQINQASRKITDIIGVIEGIAFQTNILALNAAVEAARAGEQGRGFAVVATEVRSLALRSSEAAREIKSLIGASLDTVEAGTALVNAAGATMVEIVDAVRRVGMVFDQLAGDSHEHAGGIDVVTQAVKELDHVTQQNIAVAAQSGAVAQELLEHARCMTEALAPFRLGGEPAGEEFAAFAPTVMPVVAPAMPAPALAAAMASSAARPVAPAPLPESAPASAPSGAVEYF
jgi:methyl-accepting chemotaxis protein